MEISEKVVTAYKWCRKTSDEQPEPVDTLADFARDTLAAAMRLEFRIEHQIDGRRGLVWCSRCSYGSSMTSKTDPRHNRQQADWQQAAHARLLGEGQGDE